MSGPARAALAAALLACIVAAPAAAQDPADQAPALSVATDGIAWRIADAWRALQRPDGTFRDDVRSADPLVWRDPHGNGTLGAALLLHGLRTHRSWAVTAGLHAIGAYARRPLKRDYKQVFQTLMLGTAYDAGIRRLRRDPRFRRVRPLLERRLRQASFKVLGSGRGYYNYYLVEALGVLLATEHPLRSGNPHAILHDPAASRRRVRRFLAYSLPGSALPGTTGAGPLALTLLSDPPGNPPAYHTFSLGLLSQSLLLLGPQRSLRRTRTLLDRMARASWAFMAPDGDVAWFGRSQEQSWGLAMTAAGAAIAARLRPGEDGEAARMRSASARALERLGRLYASPRFGISITPTLAGGVTRQAVLGLDRYVTASAYTGLTLLALEWLLRDPTAAQASPAAGIGADTDGAFRLARVGEFATVRHRDVWFAVKREPENQPAAGSDHSHDLRYDAGLNGLKVRTPAGVWVDVLPPRPFTDVTTDVDTTGPVIARPGPLVRPVGITPLRVAPAEGTVTLVSRFQRHTGAVVRRNVPMRFAPTACGVRIEVPARAGERWWYSAFFRGSPRIDGPSVTDGEQRVSVSAPFAIDLLHRYASGMDAGLRRVRITATASTAGPLAFTVCSAAVPPG